MGQEQDRQATMGEIKEERKRGLRGLEEEKKTNHDRVICGRTDDVTKEVEI